MDEKEYLKRIGENIARIRKEKGIKAKDLAYECNMEKSNLTPIEKGRINITALTLLKIATVLQVDVKELFEFDK